MRISDWSSDVCSSDLSSNKAGHGANTQRDDQVENTTADQACHGSSPVGPAASPAPGLPARETAGRPGLRQSIQIVSKTGGCIFHKFFYRFNEIGRAHV